MLERSSNTVFVRWQRKRPTSSPLHVSVLCKAMPTQRASFQASLMVMSVLLRQPHSAKTTNDHSQRGKTWPPNAEMLNRAGKAVDEHLSAQVILLVLAPTNHRHLLSLQAETRMPQRTLTEAAVHTLVRTRITLPIGLLSIGGSNL